MPTSADIRSAATAALSSIAREACAIGRTCDDADPAFLTIPSQLARGAAHLSRNTLHRCPAEACPTILPEEEMFPNRRAAGFFGLADICGLLEDLS